MPIRNGNATVLREIPRPDTDLNGKILDKQGNTVSPVAPTLMSRIDAKAGQEITLRKGTVWLIGILGAIIAFIPSIGMLVIVIGGLLIGYGRQDEGQVQRQAQMEEKMGTVSRDMESLNRKFDSIQESLNQQAVTDAERKGTIKGYEVGRTDKKGGH